MSYLRTKVSSGKTLLVSSVKLHGCFSAVKALSECGLKGEWSAKKKSLSWVCDLTLPQKWSSFSFFQKRR